MNDSNSKTIFLSYSHKQYTEADKLEQTLKSVSISVRRDTQLTLNQNIKDFMRTIKDRKHDYIFMLISNDFITSENCMFEVMEMLKLDEYKNKVFPVLHHIAPQANEQNIHKGRVEIFDFNTRKVYTDYWIDKYDKHQANRDNSIDWLESNKHLENIKNNIQDFLSTIAKRKLKTLQELQNNNYKELFDFLQIDDQELYDTFMRIEKMTNSRDKELEIEKLKDNTDDKSMMFIGNYYYDTGDYNKSLHFYEKSLEINLATLGDNHPSTATSYNNIGLAYYSKGQFDKAIEYYEKSLKILNTKLGKEHPSTQTVQNNLDTLMRKINNP